MQLNNTAHSLINLIGTCPFPPSLGELIAGMNGNPGTGGHSSTSLAFVIEQMKQHDLVIDEGEGYSLSEKGLLLL